jgi:hypothetical protein
MAGNMIAAIDAIWTGMAILITRQCNFSLCLNLAKKPAVSNETKRAHWRMRLIIIIVFSFIVYDTSKFPILT